MNRERKQVFPLQCCFLGVTEYLFCTLHIHITPVCVYMLFADFERASSLFQNMLSPHSCIAPTQVFCMADEYPGARFLARVNAAIEREEEIDAQI